MVYSAGRNDQREKPDGACIMLPRCLSAFSRIRLQGPALSQDSSSIFPPFRWFYIKKRSPPGVGMTVLYRKQYFTAQMRKSPRITAVISCLHSKC